MSPSATSPPTVPVIAMFVPSSVALITSSAVIEAVRAILAEGPVVSTVTLKALLAEDPLLAASVDVAVTA